jgi:hypothetical protein
LCRHQCKCVLLGSQFVCVGRNQTLN